jgi:hypothetical protein
MSQLVFTQMLDQTHQCSRIAFDHNGLFGGKRHVDMVAESIVISVVVLHQLVTLFFLGFIRVMDGVSGNGGLAIHGQGMKQKVVVLGEL